MAIDALDFDCCSDLAIELGVSVAVLIEMAVHTMHSLFRVDIHQVHWNAIPLFAVDFFELIRRFHGLHQVFGLWRFDRVAEVVEEVALPVLFENGTEHPAVTVEISELSVLQIWIEISDVCKEFRITP